MKGKVEPSLLRSASVCLSQMDDWTLLEEAPGTIQKDSTDKLELRALVNW